MGAKSLCLALLACCMAPQAVLAGSEDAARSALAHQFRGANFASEPASAAVLHIADWVVESGDNQRMPFAIVDKVDARVFVFAADGQLRGVGAALLGLAVGDDSVPGIGERPIADIKPSERTTPAGRFVASMGHNTQGVSILWVDYDSAVSLHRVITSNAKERRLQRLLSPSPLDKRISYGCINVLPRFFDDIVTPTFKGRNGIVYVLPETRTLSEVFGPIFLSPTPANEQTMATNAGIVGSSRTH